MNIKKLSLITLCVGLLYSGSVLPMEAIKQQLENLEKNEKKIKIARKKLEEMEQKVKKRKLELEELKQELEEKNMAKKIGAKTFANQEIAKMVEYYNIAITRDISSERRKELGTKFVNQIKKIDKNKLLLQALLKEMGESELEYIDPRTHEGFNPNKLRRFGFTYRKFTMTMDKLLKDDELMDKVYKAYLDKLKEK